MSTKQLWEDTLFIDGEPGMVFDNGSEIGAEADVTVRRSAGTRQLKSYPKLPTYGPQTWSRVFDVDVDWARYKRHLKRAGVAAVTASRQPVDEFGNSRGRPLTIRGRLTNVRLGDTDIESGDPQTIMYDFVVTSVA